MNSKHTLCAMALSAFGLSAAAQADLINIASNGPSSTENIGAYTGTVNYTALTATTATVTITLTNTSAPANGGYITGVGLLNADNFPSMGVTLATTSNANFANLTPPVSGSPFGTYRGGAAMGGSWLGGGSPTAGTAVGQTLTLTFNLSGTGAGTMTAASLVGLHSGHEDLIVRFRGFNNGGSDKVPGTVVPTPGSAALLGFGALALGRRRR